MKHLLNNISQEEKNSILEQHQGGMKVITENFQKMVNKKLGDVPTFLNEAKMETCEECGNELTEGGECMECGSMYEEETMEQNAQTLPSQKLNYLDANGIESLAKEIVGRLDKNIKSELRRLDMRNEKQRMMLINEILELVSINTDTSYGKPLG